MYFAHAWYKTMRWPFRLEQLKLNRGPETDPRPSRIEFRRRALASVSPKSKVSNFEPSSPTSSSAPSMQHYILCALTQAWSKKRRRSRSETGVVLSWCSTPDNLHDHPPQGGERKKKKENGSWTCMNSFFKCLPFFLFPVVVVCGVCRLDWTWAVAHFLFSVLCREIKNFS